jgi:hypothetical protein
VVQSSHRRMLDTGLADRFELAMATFVELDAASADRGC